MGRLWKLNSHISNPITEYEAPPNQFIQSMGGLWKLNSRMANILSANMIVLVGDGSRANFWKDKVDGVPLSMVYPRIFALAVNKSSNVSGLVSGMGQIGSGILRLGDLFWGGNMREILSRIGQKVFVHFVPGRRNVASDLLAKLGVFSGLVQAKESL
ncbi:hypothetical protein QYF36_012294 [Acer negundo]|nr:hypothetical protein QYF36_012294 [Acer negundo]